MKNFYFFILLLATTSTFAQKGALKEPKKIIVHDNIFLETYFHPHSSIQTTSRGRHNVRSLPTTGVGLGYALTLKRDKSRHFFEIGAGLSILSQGIQLRYVDPSWQGLYTNVIQFRAATSLQIAHGIDLIKKEKFKIYTIYGFKLHHFVVAVNGSSSTGITNDQLGYQEYIIATYNYEGGRRYAYNKKWSFTPLANVGVGVQVPALKHADRYWKFSIHYTVDPENHGSSGGTNVSYFKGPVNRLPQRIGVVSFTNQLSTLSFRVTQVF